MVVVNTQVEILLQFVARSDCVYKCRNYNCKQYVCILFTFVKCLLLLAVYKCKTLEGCADEKHTAV